MTGCPHCTHARELKAYALADAACRGCTARAIARGHWCTWSREAGTQLPQYRALLASADMSHEEVVAWLA